MRKDDIRIDHVYLKRNGPNYFGRVVVHIDSESDRVYYKELNPIKTKFNLIKSELDLSFEVGNVNDCWLKTFAKWAEIDYCETEFAQFYKMTPYATICEDAVRELVRRDNGK